MQAKGIDLNWHRVYDYFPESHVRFEHAPHIRAKVECATCHGNQAEQTVARRAVNMDMGFCVNCHKETAGVERLPDLSLLISEPMDRRHFIKLTAITGTTAALTACGNPENQLIRFIPEDDLVPGVATWKPSICPLCSAGCGVIARVMEGDAEVFRNGQAGVIRMGLAKKLEGNPEDPISQGKLCARGQAAIQVTYHPDRLDKPLKRSGERGSGQFVDISWDEAIKELTGKLD